MKRRLALITVVAPLVAMSFTTAASRELVDIRVYGRYFAEPATVQFTIVVEPDAQNRRLRVEADSEGMFRSSDIDLAGAEAERTHVFQFKNLSAGHYTLRAQVLSSDGVRGTATDQVIVMGSGH